MTNDPTKMIAQFLFKPREMVLCAGIIACAALRAPYRFWPDEIDFSSVRKEDKNCIGNTYKAMIGYKLIRKTGNFRGSKNTTSGRKGSPVFEYEASAIGVLRDLLAKIEPMLAKELEPQMELAMA